MGGHGVVKRTNGDRTHSLTLNRRVPIPAQGSGVLIRLTETNVWTCPTDQKQGYSLVVSFILALRLVGSFNRSAKD